jgi:hypothetical protein
MKLSDTVVGAIVGGGAVLIAGIRHTHHLADSFLRHCGLYLW